MIRAGIRQTWFNFYLLTKNLCRVWSTDQHQQHHLELVRSADSQAPQIDWNRAWILNRSPGESWLGASLRSSATTHVCVQAKLLQSCPALCDPMDHSPPGSSVHGSLQARTLEWVAISFSGGSSWPMDPTRISCITGRFLYHLSHQGSPNICKGLVVKRATD